MAGGRAAVAVRRALILTALGLASVAILGVYRLYLRGAGASGSAGQARPLLAAAVTVVPGIHLLGGLFPSAAYVIETSDGLIVVDSGLAADAGPLKVEMAKLGLDWRQVRAILLTHVHGDHSGGAAALRAATGARVYAGAGDAAVLEAGGPREAFFSTFHMPDQVPHPTTVDVELHGGETIAVGDVRVQAIAAPGHTPGSICYLADCRGLRAFFAGDVIMMLRGDDPPLTELGKPLGTYSAYLPPRYRGDARDSLATLRHLRTLPVPDLVLPGHPRAQSSTPDPRLSQGQWESLLDGGIRDMETLVARYEADGADFLDDNPKMLLPDLYYLGDRGGSAVYGFFSGPRFFLVNAPGGPGLVTFVNERLRQLGREPVKPAAVLLTACGVEETAGLPELMEKCRPVVVVAAAGIPPLRHACPAGTEIIPVADLAARKWFAVSPVPVAGRGVSPVGYRLTWSGKSVLLSGRIPLKMSQNAGERLIADLVHPPGDIRGYFTSMTQLHEGPSPDLWLPAAPTHGQNANLYDRQWDLEIEDNVRVLQSITSSTPAR